MARRKGAMDKNNVCFTFDRNFLSQAMAAIQSLIVNNIGMELDIYALVIGLDEKDKRKVQRLSTDKQIIKIVDVTGFLRRFEGINTMGWNHAVYVRLLLGEILPIEVKKVLYLDGDILVTGKLDTIFQVDIRDSLGAAVLDKYISRKEKAELGLPSTAPYFNTGVVYVNLQKWREVDLGKKCIRFLKRHPLANRYPDQNALNVMMKGRYVLLPLSCNVDGYHLMMPYQYIKSIIRQPVLKYYSIEDYESARNSPIIVHFIGWYLGKPWEKGNLQPYAAEFVHYAKAAGAIIPWIDRKQYAGAIKGRLKEYARKGIKKSIREGNMKRAAKYYKNCNAILGMGSFVKKALMVGKHE